MSKDTRDIIEKENFRYRNNVLQGMFQGAILFNIFINDTGTKNMCENQSGRY